MILFLSEIEDAMDGKFLLLNIKIYSEIIQQVCYNLFEFINHSTRKPNNLVRQKKVLNPQSFSLQSHQNKRKLEINIIMQFKFNCAVCMTQKSDQTQIAANCWNAVKKRIKAHQQNISCGKNNNIR